MVLIFTQIETLTKDANRKNEREPRVLKNHTRIYKNLLVQNQIIRVKHTSSLMKIAGNYVYIETVFEENKKFCHH